ncbi:uncharacterized protein LOC107270596 [Cephus cinctus]|uniref:Uncharacterized protein LOC107270596 n=1 Tax=Cephus cinctus TaxID=211228 RepID=A0AAJ7RMJ3_CEPCN|nr:uncharacterized protein LOC107270596 [Cephus cinctus]
MQHTVGIEVRVTNEIPAPSQDEISRRDVVPPWIATSSPSPSTPVTPTNPHQYLSPHVFQGRNSLCSANDYTLRRRRPMTLRIGPRLSLPNRSTSAPATTTDTEWPALRLINYRTRVQYRNDPTLDHQELNFCNYFNKHLCVTNTWDFYLCLRMRRNADKVP